MIKPIVFWVLMSLCMVAGLEATAHAQLTHLDSVKRLRTRTARNMGFAILPGFVGGDAWYFRNWGHGYGGDGLYSLQALLNNFTGKQNYAPMSDKFDTSYRWHEYPEADSIGMNVFNGYFMWQDLGDSPPSYYNNTDTAWSATPDILVTNPREPYTPYCQGGSLALNTSISNSPYARIECERHTHIAGDSEYLGFLSGSTIGLTGSNFHDPTGTFPPWLRGTVDAADTINTVVRMEKNSDPPGVFDSSFWYKTIFSTDNDIAAWTTGGWNRKLLVRLRVRLDSLNASDSLAKELNHLNPDSAFEVRVWQGNTERDSTVFYITPSTFPHAGSGWDTVSFTFFSDPADPPPDLKFELSWQGKNSLSADYIEVMTARLEIADTTAAKLNQLNLNPWGSYLWNFLGKGGGKYSSYEGLTANHDSLLKSLVSRILKPFDSVYNFVYAVDEPGWGCTDILKRLYKIMRDSTQMDAMPVKQPGYWWPTGQLHNPELDLLEGVHLGWHDSSEYADPLFFGIESYFWSNAPVLPVRTKSSDSAAIGQWLLRSAAFGVFNSNDSLTSIFSNPYSRLNYVTSAQEGFSWFIRQLRWAHGITLETRTPYFHQRFFDICLGGGKGPNNLTATPVYEGNRSMTGAEFKFLFHAAVAGGASGIEPFVLLNLPYETQYFDPLGWGLVGPNGDTSMYAYFNGHSDSLWAGWAERFDTAKTLFPLLTLYGNELLRCDWLGDFLAPELRPDDSIPFVWNTMHIFDDSARRDMISTNPATNTAFVYTSAWRDTTTGDTLLYIVNMRTDDSWDTSGHCQTFDRRYITMKMKAPHYVADVDTLHNMGKVRTPHVGAGDSLVVWLLPGDGVLLRLTPAPNVQDSSSLPNSISIDIFPDPSPSNITVSFNLPQAGQAKLTLTDATGRETLLLSSGLDAGQHEVIFDASNYPNGEYFCRIESGGLKATKRVVVVR